MNEHDLAIPRDPRIEFAKPQLNAVLDEMCGVDEALQREIADIHATFKANAEWVEEATKELNALRDRVATLESSSRQDSEVVRIERDMRAAGTLPMLGGLK
jgi:hypothetical protein